MPPFDLGPFDELSAAELRRLVSQLRAEVMRLQDCTRAVLAVQGRSLHAIFGSPDDLKFRSSMTLFALAAGEDETDFRQALDRFCAGRADERTLALLGR